MNKQNETPLFDQLKRHDQKDSLSFHVPGHKFGKVFAEKGIGPFENILKLDATEISGLDDLHGAEGVILHAKQLLSDYYGSKSSYFLVNGSTSGNIAAIMASVRPGEKVLVQRNSHKSVLHGIELAGAEPVFVMPEHEEATGRYSKITKEMIHKALKAHPEIKAIVLTYPDYFGRTYQIQEIIEYSHVQKVPVIVDEAHGVHFKLGDPFPLSSVDLKADIVIQSAHKMAPAMTMASFLHVQTERVDLSRLEYCLQMLQSSSPSYPIMASLDLARYFLAAFTEEQKRELLEFIDEVRSGLAHSPLFELLPLTERDDPLKITLIPHPSLSGFELAEQLENAGLFPEMATADQVLFTLGLTPHINIEDLEKRLETLNCQLKIQPAHDTIKRKNLSIPALQTLEVNYQDMQYKTPVFVPWKEAAGRICAKAIIPYPPGIPLVLKGERVTKEHHEQILSLQQEKASFQNKDIELGMWVF
ncbi:aminotransferase class I/II-fold pyridoxal phosphate-dependent enzyme [Halobacillus sp. Marseille-Q1614]|uniref:aminotransferase class I/II-fold pyridoxal phosphate-dependent enzyme n=1 Tax=Halobacillus sp. Marseille-Q1614 TaxID=2709134 RepID=UPI00156F7F3E|nr:aminotransferase class I/II-fold pyridoxal phosphate-dependent enzyme [Halobacillus sp. Marseille-Q1614]